MGVIIRQGFKTAVASYLGLFLGMANVLFIYPRFLTEAEFGLTRVVLDTASLLINFTMLGTNTSLVRFFPRFQHLRGYGGYLFLMLTFPLVGYLIFCGVFFAFRDAILGLFVDESPMLVQYWPYLLLTTFFMAYMVVFDIYCRVHNRAFAPAMVREVGTKFLLAGSVVAYSLGWLSFEQMLTGIALTYLVATGVLLLYLWRNGWLHLRPQLRHYSRGFVAESLTYGGYTLVGGLGYLLAYRIDTIMIPIYLGLPAVAIYGVALGIARVMELPRLALGQISSPILNKALETGDYAEFRALYQKSAMTMVIITCLMGLMLWVNVEDFYTLMPNSAAFGQGRWLVLVFIISRLLENASGLSPEIVLFSSLYRHYVWLTGFLVAANLGLNIVLIPQLGLMGAAVATLVALLLDMLLRVWLIHWKFRAQPFTWGMLGIVAFTVGLWGLSLVLNVPTTHPLATVAEIGLRSALLTFAFVWVLHRSRLSPDFNQLVHALLRRFAPPLLRVFR
jgi:O-antigen/teichoic acid export membrane protein